MLFHNCVPGCIVYRTLVYRLLVQLCVCVWDIIYECLTFFFSVSFRGLIPSPYSIDFFSFFILMEFFLRFSWWWMVKTPHKQPTKRFFCFVSLVEEKSFSFFFLSLFGRVKHMFDLYWRLLYTHTHSQVIGISQILVQLIYSFRRSRKLTFKTLSFINFPIQSMYVFVCCLVSYRLIFFFFWFGYLLSI